MLSQAHRGLTRVPSRRLPGSKLCRHIFHPADLLKALNSPLEVAAEQGRQAVNGALAVGGSSVKFPSMSELASRPKDAGAERSKARSTEAIGPSGRVDSLFWDPHSKDSPFVIGREIFIAKHLAQGVDSRTLIPDEDVEAYVDELMSQDVLSNMSLPPGVGRQLFIRMVRIVQRVIINAVSLAEGELLGKQLKLLAQPSDGSVFKHSKSAKMDPRVMALIARRVCEDHVIDGEEVSPYLRELGLPWPMVRRLYEDIITLSLTLVFDVSLTFQVRCLGHALTCEITPDKMLHLAPGWDVALEDGAFGVFNDAEKRQWASVFVDDLMKDETILMRAYLLPESVQRQMFTRVAMVMLNLSETALNHFRIHVAGMAFRPALLG